MPAVVTGQPARSAICRAMLKPVAPSGFAQPMSTSSTEAGSMRARSMAARTTCPPSVAPCVRLKAPRQDLVNAVRAVDTMTASTTALLLARTLAPGLHSRACFRFRRGPRPAHGRRVLEAASPVRQLRDQARRFPELRIGMRVAGELAHAAHDASQTHAARVEHRAAARHRESIA